MVSRQPNLPTHIGTYSLMSRVGLSVCLTGSVPGNSWNFWIKYLPFYFTIDIPFSSRSVTLPFTIKGHHMKLYFTLG